jgi:phosphotransferase system enzyme I (PtsI)
MAPLLLGLGADEFSVSPPMVPLVKRLIRSVRYSQAEQLANAALASESGSEVMDRCRALVEQVAPELLEFIA